MIPQTFIENAGDILGDTQTGLSGSKIARYLSAYGVDYNIEIPYPAYPFPISVPNKRYALKKNLSAFTPKQQFKIIKELCEYPELKDSPQVRELKIKLLTKFKELNTDIEMVNEILVDETKAWLDGYPKALEQYSNALDKYKGNIFERNLLDDLRLSLELLVKEILKNSKSLENQHADIGRFIKNNGGSKELINMFVKLIEYFTKYQNEYVKHDSKVIEEEIEFMLEITSSFMKHFIRMNNKPKQ